jgi:elongation factor Ts
MSFTAKDVQALRQATGAGMMDAKRALEATDGDAAAAAQLLREKGLAKAAERADRENAQGAVALFVDGNVGSIVQLKCETDFVASSQHFKNLAATMAALVTAKGVEATAERAKEVEDLRLTLKEHIELGQVVRIEAEPGHVLDSYLHIQGERGVNAVLVELVGGTAQLAHDIAVHVAFARPRYLSRDEVPADEVEKERATLEAITRNEGKPEQALPKIVEGRLNGFFKEICLLEQPYAKDDKRSISQLLDGASIVRFAQVEIG